MLPGLPHFAGTLLLRRHPLLRLLLLLLLRLLLLLLPAQQQFPAPLPVPLQAVPAAASALVESVHRVEMGALEAAGGGRHRGWWVPRSIRRGKWAASDSAGGSSRMHSSRMHVCLCCARLLAEAAGLAVDDEAGSSEAAAADPVFLQLRCAGGVKFWLLIGVAEQADGQGWMAAVQGGRCSRVRQPAGRCDGNRVLHAACGISQLPIHPVGPSPSESPGAEPRGIQARGRLGGSGRRERCRHLRWVPRR